MEGGDGEWGVAWVKPDLVHCPACYRGAGWFACLDTEQISRVLPASWAWGKHKRGKDCLARWDLGAERRCSVRPPLPATEESGHHPGWHRNHREQRSDWLSLSGALMKVLPRPAIEEAPSSFTQAQRTDILTCPPCVPLFALELPFQHRGLGAVKPNRTVYAHGSGGQGAGGREAKNKGLVPGAAEGQPLAPCRGPAANCP